MIAALITIIITLATSYNSKCDKSALFNVEAVVDSLRTKVGEIKIRDEYRDKNLEDLNTKMDEVSDDIGQLLQYFNIAIQEKKNNE